MGGGDLNLKKSWHPSTLRNIERVWKAEQKHEAEQKKIEQLQKELAEERSRDEIRQYAEDQGVVQKRSERLDWMYQGPAAMVNRDDYLLGRSVDKTFELLQQVESGNLVSEEDNVPGSVARHATGSGSVLTVDLENKIREDPLLHIRKQEEDSKRRLLDNPVRMKQIQLLLRKMNKKQSKKSNKGAKKSKRHASESSSDGERRKSSGHKRSRSRTESKKQDVKREATDFGKRKSSREQERDHRDRNSKSSWSGHRDHDRDTSVNSYGARVKKERSQSPVRKHDFKTRHSAATKTKLNEEERERRLQEMIKNAKWRDEKRTSYVNDYREQEKKEERMQMQGSSNSFIRPLLAKAANNTVEGRIKSNIYNIQRSRSDLDKNFARR